MDILNFIIGNPVPMIIGSLVIATLYFRGRAIKNAAEAARAKNEMTLSEYVIRKNQAEKESNDAEEDYRRVRDEFNSSNPTDDAS